MSVAGVTHTPQTGSRGGDHGRPLPRVPGAQRCARHPRAATLAVTGGRSSPAAAGERHSRRLPGKALLQTQLFSTAAAGGRGSENRGSRSLPFPASSTRPAAAPRPGRLPSRRAPWTPERSSRARSQVSAGPPRGGPPPAPPGPGCSLSLPRAARTGSRGSNSPGPGSASPSPQPSPSRGFPLRLLAATSLSRSLSGPAGRSGKAEGGERRGGGDGGEGRGSTGGGGGAGEAGAPTWAAAGLARREEKEGRGQRKKEAAKPPRPGPGPAPLPSHHRRLRPALWPSVRGEGSGRGEGAAGGRGSASGGECAAEPGGCERSGDPRGERRGGPGAWEPVTAPARRRLPESCEGPQSLAGEPRGQFRETVSGAPRARAAPPGRPGAARSEQG